MVRWWNMCTYNLIVGHPQELGKAVRLLSLSILSMVTVASLNQCPLQSLYMRIYLTTPYEVETSFRSSAEVSYKLSETCEKLTFMVLLFPVSIQGRLFRYNTIDNHSFPYNLSGAILFFKYCLKMQISRIVAVITDIKTARQGTYLLGYLTTLPDTESSLILLLLSAIVVAGYNPEAKYINLIFNVPISRQLCAVRFSFSSW